MPSVALLAADVFQKAVKPPNAPTIVPALAVNMA